MQWSRTPRTTLIQKKKMGSREGSLKPSREACHYDPTSTWYYAGPPGCSGAVPSPLQPFEWLVDASPDVLTYLFTYLSVFYLSFSSFYYC